MKIYISGKITNNPFYKEQFKSATEDIAELGHTAVNPVDCTQESPNKSWIDYMKEDIKLLMDCEAIYMLKGFRTSRGARLELLIAKKLGYKVFYQL